MSDWNRSDTIGVLKVMLFFAVIAVWSCFAFRSYVNAPNSFIKYRKRTDERLERIEQKIDLLLKSANND